jgi:signal transduction histidine kinase
MQSLPTLALGSRPLELPLSPQSAGALLGALVAADAGAAPADLTAGLAVAIEADPVLSLWVALSAVDRGVTRLATWADLAAWLSGNILDVLVWRDGSNGSAMNPAWCSAGCVDQVNQWIDSAKLVPQTANLVRRELHRLQAAERRDEPGEVVAPSATSLLSTITASDAAVLAAVAARLTRLRQLESQFAARLEIEKLDALKELAYGAGHEINNPLANISARAQTLLEDEGDPERRRKLAAINTQAFRAHEMIADMMLFARPPKPKFERLDLVRLVAQLIAELAPAAADQNTELLLHATADAGATIVEGDKTQLSVAIRALVVNALEALVTGGRVEVSIRSAPVPANSRAALETVQIAVSDNGPGISEETRRHIFDPFFSGREAGRGLGFGLSKCWRIAGLHGGSVEVASTPACGATFTLALPVRPFSG